jgi:hypothetical protein
MLANFFRRHNSMFMLCPNEPPFPAMCHSQPTRFPVKESADLKGDEGAIMKYGYEVYPRDAILFW